MQQRVVFLGRVGELPRVLSNMMQQFNGQRTIGDLFVAGKANSTSVNTSALLIIQV